jgi:hypothetical protein
MFAFRTTNTIDAETVRYSSIEQVTADAERSALAALDRAVERLADALSITSQFGRWVLGWAAWGMAAGACLYATVTAVAMAGLAFSWAGGLGAWMAMCAVCVLSILASLSLLEKLSDFVWSVGLPLGDMYRKAKGWVARKIER